MVVLLCLSQALCDMLVCYKCSVLIYKYIYTHMFVYIYIYMCLCIYIVAIFMCEMDKCKNLPFHAHTLLASTLQQALHLLHGCVY